MASSSALGRDLVGAGAGGRGAVAYFQERAEDAADALRDYIGRSTGNALLPRGSGAGGSGGGAKYLDTADDKVALIASQINATTPDEQMEGLRRIIAMISKGRDASSFLPGALKLTSSASLEVRKLVYIIILHYAQHSSDSEDLTLLSVNSFQRDSMDPSPLIRGMAIKVLTGLRNSMVNSIVELSVKRAVRDSSAYVRKITALALPRCVESDPANLASHLSSLSPLLGDRSPSVIGAALVAFQRIFDSLAPRQQSHSDSTDMTLAASSSKSQASLAWEARWDLIHPHYRKICHALADLDEWSQVVACEVLLQYARCCFERPEDMSAESTDGKGKAKANASSYKRPADLDLLTYKASQLFKNNNPAVVLAATKLHYYLLPLERQAPMLKALVTLVSPGAPNGGGIDRDVTYVVLIQIIWLLNGGSSEPLSNSQPLGESKHDMTDAPNTQLNKADWYRRTLAPYITIFWPRSDCSRSRFAPGVNNTLSTTLSTSTNSSSGLGAAAAGIAGGVAGAAGGGISLGTGGGGGGSTTASSATLASASAVDSIFHAKLEILQRLVRPEHLAWIVPELEDVVCMEWKDARCQHALRVLQHIVRLHGSAAFSSGHDSKSLDLARYDRWGVIHRCTSFALELLANISTTRWSLAEPHGTAYAKEDHAMPLRPKITLGLIELLCAILEVQDRVCRSIKPAMPSADGREVKGDSATVQAAAHHAKEKTPAKEADSETMPVVFDSTEAASALAKITQEIQDDMFQIFQRACDLLYTSGESVSADAGGKKLKLISKRNAGGPAERQILFWIIGEYCRLCIEVDWTDPGEDGMPKSNAEWTAKTKSAAELLGVDLLRKAAGNFEKESPEARLSIITTAVKVCTYLHETERSDVGTGERDAALESTDRILQLAMRDANLDLRAHANRYAATLRSAGIRVYEPRVDPKIHQDRLPDSPEEACGMLFVSDVKDWLRSNDEILAMLRGSSHSRLTNADQFGSMQLLMPHAAHATRDIPEWALPGKGVPPSSRDPLSLAPPEKGGNSSAKYASSTAKLSVGKGNHLASSTPASMYEYVVDGESAPTQDPAPSASHLAPAKSRIASSSSSRAPSPFGAPADQPRPSNPKYQDLDSFLNEEPEDAPVHSLPVTAQLQSLDLHSRPAPQDDEYHDEYDEDDFEEDDHPPQAATSLPVAGRSEPFGSYAQREDELDSDDYEEEDTKPQEGRSLAGTATYEESKSVLPAEEENAWAS